MFKRGRGIIFGRRGISPLIATVLLVAFAVSIGTMIMSWGKEASATIGGCEDTAIEVQKFGDKPIFCYDTLNNNIKIAVKNTGTTDIKKLKMHVISADLKIEEKDLSDTLIKSGSVKSKDINYVKAGKFRVEIIPVVSIGGKDKVCSEKYVYMDPIDKCN